MSACANLPSALERHHNAVALAADKHWQETTLTTTPFMLTTFALATQNPAKEITIYIEGDGFAWASRTQISLNPTPIMPMALKLALSQPEGTAIYLARPCQFAWQETVCEEKYWTSDRFSSVVVNALSEALTQLKQRYHAQKIILVGYSGGATLAALLAVKRDDVSQLITVAGNLDHADWTAMHSLTPLNNSLNPKDSLERLQHIQQTHFVGEQDKIIPPLLTSRFVGQYQNSSSTEIVLMNAFTHSCCWAEQWPQLWQQTQH